MELEGRFQGKFYDLEDLSAAVAAGQLPAFDSPAPLALDPLLHGDAAADWPRGRSVWCAREGATFILLHARNHLTFCSSSSSSSPLDIRSAFVYTMELLLVLRAHLATSRVEFARDPRLGYLGPDPVYLGTAMEFYARLRLPFLGGFPLLDVILTRLRLRRVYQGEIGATVGKAAAAAAAAANNQEVEEEAVTGDGGGGGGGGAGGEGRKEEGTDDVENLKKDANKVRCICL